jgi:predicted TIM-barrel fold metal-dependent hydrolase
MKIDSHVHITPPDIAENWEKYAEKEPYFYRLSRSKNNKFACAEDVIAAIEGAGFDMAVVFGFAFRDMGLCRYVNDYVIEKTKAYPQKLIGFGVVSPHGDAGKEIERCYNAGLKGIGELFPEGQGIDLENKKETMFFTEICRELGLPLLLHANEPVGHSYPGKTNVSLKQLETFITNNRSLKIILAHWGGGLIFYETMKEIKEKFVNAYYDTAATPFLYDDKIYRTVKALDLCEKLLFGSDFPLLPHSRYQDALEKSGFSDSEKNLIIGGNFKKILKFL